MNTESLTLRGMFKFEKLDVWQKAIDLADLVYSAAIYKAARPNVERIAPHAGRQLAISYQLLAVA
jgi:hypothetical protein